MPVVINEFEAVPGEAPSSESAEQNRDGNSGKGKEKAVADKVLRIWHERQERVRAH